MAAPLHDEALDTLFRSARTYNAWQDREIADGTLQKLYNLTKMGPTSTNCQPARLVFVKTDAAKQRLKPLLSEGNQDKSMAAPVTVIVAHDSQFYEHLPTLFPHTDAKSWFEGKPEKIVETAFRNGSLQGAYLILAARALGLDCGPMSGFDADGVNQAFFPEGRFQANFLINIGYGDSKGMHERAPRLPFDEACEIL